MTNEKQQRKLIEAVGNYLAEHLEQNCPVTILFRPYNLNFDVYGTKNIGTMQLRFKAYDEVSLRLGVFRDGTDRLYSNFLPSSNTEDMIRYLRNPASHQEWLEQIAHLSDSVDNYWD